MSKSHFPTVQSPDVELVCGVPMVSSLKIAESFDKQHGHVLREIKSLLTELPKEFTESNFGPSEYQDGTGRKLPAFNLTRDAFTLLAMGFTGKQALAWKLRYIEAFNAMEGKLAAQQKLAVTEARKEGITLGLRAALHLTPERRERFLRILRYRNMGLENKEIGKLLDLSASTVSHNVAEARRLGLEAS